MRAAIMKGGAQVVAVNDPFLDVEYMVSGYHDLLYKLQVCITFDIPHKDNLSMLLCII